MVQQNNISDGSIWITMWENTTWKIFTLFTQENLHNDFNITFISQSFCSWGQCNCTKEKNLEEQGFVMLTKVIGYSMYVCTEPHSDWVLVAYRKQRSVLILCILIIILLAHISNNVLIQ